MIGRAAESALLRSAYESEQSEFVAVYGRRRIGKTYLINEVFNSTFAFHIAGMENSSRRELLDLFRLALRGKGWKCPRLSGWLEAFFELERYLDSLPSGKKVVFLDELPWFDTPKSGFLSAFENFWNGWSTSRKDVLLIICGSATTWIIDKVLRSRGGLYNRVTRRIPLAPFTLAECEEYAKYRGFRFTRRDLCECYMALGGVAYYWSRLQDGKTVAENFDALFFGTNSELRDEFRGLFSSTFKLSTLHSGIIALLAKRNGGLTRDAIRVGLGRSVSGSVLSETLAELEECGFIRAFGGYGKRKKEAVFQLIDHYVLFYYRFLEDYHAKNECYWTRNFRSPMLNAWRGLAFERVCMTHIREIKAALGISGIAADVYSWFSRGKGKEEGGAQIDLLLDRADNAVDICEMKFAGEEYSLSREEAEKIERRVAVFQREACTKKPVRVVMVTSFGVKRGLYSGCYQAGVTLDHLFQPRSAFPTA